MKVLMTADTIGGVWTFAMELIGALKNFDIEVTLATMGRLPSPDQRMQAARLSNLSLRASEYKLEWMSDPWDDMQRTDRWLMSLQEQVQPDVVHLNAHAHAVLPWQAPVIVTAHSCRASWWAAVRAKPLPQAWLRYRDAIRAGLHAANAVVAPTHAMASTIQDLYDLAQRPHVISNGRSADLFKPGPKHPFVLSAGRFWDEAKNLAALDAASAGLCWPVYVAGPLQHPDRLAASPAYNTRLLGTLPLMHMRQWMSRADIYALPARYEPFGLSVLEAALAGCALVLGDISSLRENWDDAAVFASPDDTDDLRSVLLSLIKNPQHRRRLAAEARRRAMTLSPQRMAAAYAELYQQLIVCHPLLQKTDRELFAQGDELLPT